MKRLAIILLGLAVLFMTVPAVQAVDTTGPLSGIQILPKDHIWNAPVNTLPVAARSADYINSIGQNTVVSGYLGYPINVVDSSVPHVMVTSWGSGAWDADKVAAPFPTNALVETGSSDHHLFIVDKDEKAVYEFYHATKSASGTWSCEAEVRWNLTDYRIMPDGWGSADAAGMAMFPGLLRYDEVNSGTITHALRMAIGRSQNAHVWPATHHAGVADLTAPPMGQRFRLKASFDTSGYSPQMKTILEGLKTYGVMVADNTGPGMVLSVVPDSRWSYTTLAPLKQLKASDFEAVDVSSLMISKNSGQARIDVTPLPSAQFTANITQGLAPLSVQFSDQSASAGTTTYSWDMNNDGVVDYTTKTPSHTYQSVGDYTVKLTVTNASGSDSEIKTNYIKVSSSLTTINPATNPAAQFTANITQGQAPLSVKFTDRSVSAGTTTYAWDMNNDGVVEYTTKTPSHTFKSAGNYTVKLTIKNASGSDSEIKTNYIKVSSPRVASTPAAQFTANTTQGLAPLSVKFTDRSVSAGTTTYGWDMNNDGVVEYTTKTPSHTFKSAGNYTVKLTIKNASGSDSEIKTNYIRVVAPNSNYHPVSPSYTKSHWHYWYDYVKRSISCS